MELEAGMNCPGMGAGCGLGDTTAAAAAPWWQTIIGGAVTTVEDILKAKNTVRGVLTQTSPGVFQYVQPTGSQVTLPVGTSQVVSATGSSGMGMILLAGAGIFLVFMLAKGKG
jgi:hypothetical protein